jgi:eukaryotic-like serine/threonine-protein kinase
MNDEASYGDFKPNALIDKRYRVIAGIGWGGQAVVYKAADTQDNDRVLAVKVLPWEKIKYDDKVLTRFASESAVGQKLTHPNIAKVYKAARVEGQFCYIAMEYVDGTALSDRIADDKNPLTFPEIVRILHDTAAALQYAHAEHVIHRDLKPANILLTTAGDVKLVDFGLARDMELGHTITQVGETIGTPYYMSPEQFTRTARLDERTDMYSLGIIAFEMVTGTQPFRDGAYHEIANAHLTDPLPDMHSMDFEIPRWFALFVGVCTQKERNARYRSMDQVLIALEGPMRKMGLIEGPTASESLLKRFLGKLFGNS